MLVVLGGRNPPLVSSVSLVSCVIHATAFPRRSTGELSKQGALQDTYVNHAFTARKPASVRFSDENIFGSTIAFYRVPIGITPAVATTPNMLSLLVLINYYNNINNSTNWTLSKPRKLCIDASRRLKPRSPWTPSSLIPA